MKKVWFSWSSGKDSAFALYELLKRKDLEVTALFTSMTETFNRVSMHSTREELLDEQARQIDLPIHKVKLPYPCTNAIYTEQMQRLITQAEKEKIDYMAFGDLFLADIKKYRITLLEGSSIKAIFPLWKRDTTQLAQQIIKENFKTIITCVNEKKLDPSYSGRKYTSEYLASLPSEVDPCGENGEFHSYVYAAPMYKEEIKIEIGESITRDGCRYTDIKLRR